MKRLLLVFLIFTCGSAFAQFTSTASHIRWGASLPAACHPTTGDVFFKTSATVGVYACLTTNTWTLLAGSGGSGTVGPGTTNTIPLFSAATVIGNSNLTQDGGTGQLIASKSLNGPAVTAGAFSATPIIDLSLCNRCELATTTANITSVSFTNKKAGDKFSLVIPQG